MHLQDWKIKVGVVVELGDKALLIREWSNKKNGYFWNIIKGTFEDLSNETLLECAIRESREEAGIEVELTHFLHCVVSSKEERIQFNFVGRYLSETSAVVDKKELEKQGEDIQEVRWFIKEDLKNITKEEFINERSYDAIQQWLKGDLLNLKILDKPGGMVIELESGEEFLIGAKQIIQLLAEREDFILLKRLYDQANIQLHADDVRNALLEKGVADYLGKE